MGVPKVFRGPLFCLALLFLLLFPNYMFHMKVDSLQNDDHHQVVITHLKAGPKDGPSQAKVPYKPKQSILGSGSSGSVSKTGSSIGIKAKPALKSSAGSTSNSNLNLKSNPKSAPAKTLGSGSPTTQHLNPSIKSSSVKTSRASIDKCFLTKGKLWATKQPLKVYVHKPIDALMIYFVKSDLDKCARTQFGTEIIIPQYFATEYAYTVDSPEKSDIIFLPIYPKCVHKGFKGIIPIEQEKDTVDLLFRWTIGNFSKAYPTVSSRYSGRDHVFIFPSGAGARVFKSWEKLIPDSIFLGPEASNWRVRNKPKFKPYFDPKKDVLIPGHYYAASETIAKGKPWVEREILALYCGDFEKSEQRAAVGKLGKEFVDSDKVVIKGDCDTNALSPNSKFCLVPQGFTPWTIRLYEAMFAGCIPVVFGDEYIFPFADTIDYTQFVVRLPEQDIGSPLVPTLDGLAKAKGQAMYDALVASRVKLQYNSTLPNNFYKQLEQHLVSQFCAWTLQLGPPSRT